MPASEACTFPLLVATIGQTVLVLDSEPPFFVQVKVYLLVPPIEGVRLPALACNKPVVPSQIFFSFTLSIVTDKSLMTGFAFTVKIAVGLLREPTSFLEATNLYVFVEPVVLMVIGFVLMVFRIRREFAPELSTV